MNQKLYGIYLMGLYCICLGRRASDRMCGQQCMQITAEPATVAISVHHDNYTNGCIEKTGRFAITVLSEKTEPSIIELLDSRQAKKLTSLIL